jgi:Ca-activated chloride channel family protein
MSDDRLTSLKSITAPEPESQAREAALAAAMQAYDGVHGQESAPTTQGSVWRERLMVISNPMRWTMNIRIPVTAGVAGLILLPLAWQLSTQTALTPPDLFRPEPATTLNVPADEEVAETVLADRADDALAQTGEGRTQSQAISPAQAAPGGDADQLAMEAAPMSESEVGGLVAMPSPSPARERDAAGYAAPIDGDVFASFADNAVKIAADEPVSTFSVDVDTASYAYVRRALESGTLPNPDAVRVEEMINYFDYDYPVPPSAETPFSTNLSLYPAPWAQDHLLLQIGIKGFETPLGSDAPKNLVFLIDSSGSMNEPDKLPLLKQSFALLIDQLGESDTISIVTYAGSAGVVLEPTSASEKAKILDALNNLQPGGSTAGAAGIEAAYRLAEQSMSVDGINRVILATDGDFNVGISDPEGLTRLIEAKRNEGISLSVLGFGTGNLNDAIMQSLAQNGNGNAAYIDSFREARKVLVDEITANLFTIASDVKIQVEFNPATVAEYRLIGYETRALNREDFNNDAVDAGDIGAGHTVTALYEITPIDADSRLVDPLRYGEGTELTVEALSPEDEFAFVKLRYKLPGEDTSHLLEEAVTVGSALTSLDEVPTDTRFATAVAAFGQKLRGSDVLRSYDFGDIRALAQGGRGDDPFGYRAEFVALVDLAQSLTGQD